MTLATDVIKQSGRPDIGSIIASRRINFAAKQPGRPQDPGSARVRKPWLAEGISPRTYYRRKAKAPAEPAVSADVSPQQHCAHVAAWIATLGPIRRLEYKAYTRRCHIAMQWP